MSATKLNTSTLRAVVVGMALASLATASIAEKLPPADMVVQGTEVLADAVKRPRQEPQNGGPTIADGVRDFLRRYADMRGASRIILGKFWATATADQRNRFLDALSQRVTRMILELIVDVRLGTIAVEPFQGDPEELPISVDVSLETKEGSMIKFKLRMHNSRGDWLILDVVGEGVSYLKLCRSEFRQIATEHGLEKAISRFDQPASE